MATKKITLSELKRMVKTVLKEETMIAESNVNSPIRKYVYFSYNFPHDFIEQIWGEGAMGRHLKDKFTSYYKKHGDKAVMTAFYVNLDSENQQMLEDYIINNYRG
jgi:hypothetical protein